jgi:PAS domain S-box-containing protein
MVAALLESEAKYRTLFQATSDGILIADLETKLFRYANPAACRLLGYSEKEFTTIGVSAIHPKADLPRVMAEFEAQARGDKTLAADLPCLRKDGTIVYVDVTAGPMTIDDRVCNVGFFRDITERKKTEEQLQRYAAELERNNEEVKNFAYIVSHDLRVPLVNLKGYTSELRTALEVIGSNFDVALPHLNDAKRSEVAMALHEDVPEALEFITNSVSRMDSFINAILILARLGRQDLKPEPIDMNALVQTTVETMSHQLQERRIEVIVGSLPQVAADRTAMEQIIGNILSNAVKYLDSSRPGRIEVTAQANGAETTFRIRDNGRGIAAEDMGKVFAPFRRAGKQDTQGEGMGLAYVQTLVRRHGGRISCESELGKGTTFTFTISTRPEKGARDA